MQHVPMEEAVTPSGGDMRRFRKRKRLSSDESRRPCLLIRRQNINHKWWRRRTRRDIEDDAHSSDTACSSSFWSQCQEPTNDYSYIRVHKHPCPNDDSGDDSKTIFYGYYSKVLLSSSLTNIDCLKQQEQNSYDSSIMSSNSSNHVLRAKCSRLKSQQTVDEQRKYTFFGSLPRIICFAVLLLLVTPTVSAHVLNANFTGNNSQRHFDASNTVAHMEPPGTVEQRIGQLDGSNFVDQGKQGRRPSDAITTSTRLTSTKITPTTAKPMIAMKNYSSSGSMTTPQKLLTEKEAFLRAAKVPIIDMRPGPGSTSYFHSHEDEDFASLLYIKVSEESWRSYVQFKKDTCRDVDEENIAGRVVNSTENGYFSWEENSFHQELRKIIFPETSKGSLRSLIGTPLLRSLDPRFFASTPDSLCKAQEMQSDAEMLKKAEENQFEDFLINKILHPSILSLPRVRKTNCTSSATAVANSTEATIAAAIACNGATNGGAGVSARWNGTEKVVATSRNVTAGVTPTIPTFTLNTTTTWMGGANAGKTPPTAFSTRTRAADSGGGTSSGTTTVRTMDGAILSASSTTMGGKPSAHSSSVSSTTTVSSTSSPVQSSSVLPAQTTFASVGSSPSATTPNSAQTMSPPLHLTRVL